MEERNWKCRLDGTGVCACDMPRLDLTPVSQKDKRVIGWDCVSVIEVMSLVRDEDNGYYC